MKNKGHTLIEHLVIITSISIIALSVYKTCGGFLQDTVTKSSCHLIDKVYVSGYNPGSGYCSNNN